MDQFYQASLKDSWKGIVGLVFVLGSLILAAKYLDIAALRTQIEAAGWLGPAVLIVAKASTIVIAPLGGGPLYPIAGALFGFWKGSAYLIAGDMLGGTISFYLARYFGRNLVTKMLGESDGFITRALAHMTTVRGFLTTRICFATFPEIATWGAGLTTLPFLPFIIIHGVVGLVPTFITAGLGAAITSSEYSYLTPLVFVVSGLFAAGGFLLFSKIIEKPVQN